MKIHIRNGHVVDPANRIDARQDLFIAAGRIVAVGQAPEGFTANRTVDAAGVIVAPGWGHPGKHKGWHKHGHKHGH